MPIFGTRTKGNLYIRFNSFDYLDEYSLTIFGASGPTSGTIFLLDGPTGSIITSTTFPILFKRKVLKLIIKLNF